MCKGRLLFSTDLESYGWTHKDGQLQVQWDVPENIHKAQARLDFVLKGCKCKGGCKSRRCRCRKDQRACGPGCQCINCGNLHASNPPGLASQDTPEVSDVQDADGEDDESSDDDLHEDHYYGEEGGDDDVNDDNLAGDVMQDHEMENIMEFVFG